MSFCVMSVRPGVPFPDCVTGSFIAQDNHDACRQASAAMHSDLATFFYRAEFFTVPQWGKVKLPVVAGDGCEYWAIG